MHLAVDALDRLRGFLGVRERLGIGVIGPGILELAGLLQVLRLFHESLRLLLQGFLFGLFLVLRKSGGQEQQQQSYCPHTQSHFLASFTRRRRVRVFHGQGCCIRRSRIADGNAYREVAGRRGGRDADAQLVLAKLAGEPAGVDDVVRRDRQIAESHLNRQRQTRRTRSRHTRIERWIGQAEARRHDGDNIARDERDGMLHVGSSAAGPMATSVSPTTACTDLFLQ